MKKFKDYDKSDIIFCDSLDAVCQKLSQEKQSTYFVLDRNVFQHYPALVNVQNLILIDSHEKNKTQKTIDGIIDFLLENGAGRDSLLVAIGGGIVCDMAAFAASVFMRGIDFVLVPTTLLAKTDAAIGGKTGINYKGFKNMLGTFKHPRFVLIFPGFLQTLGYDQFKNGLAEVIKHALIKSESLFNFMQKNKEGIMEREEELISMLIHQSVRIKCAVVMEDELEKGGRKHLNFGHSFGHAIEKLSGIPHGEAVSIGMVMACVYSERFGHSQESFANTISKLLAFFDLPIRLQVPFEDLCQAIRMDKKRKDDSIEFIFLSSIGVSLTQKITLSKLKPVSCCV
jgi:3-dehydroquinate synthase